MHESPAHDAHVLHGLIAEVERSIASLQTDPSLPGAVRDQALARRGAVDGLRAAGGSDEVAASGDGLLDKAQRALDRFAAGVSNAPASSGAGVGLDGLEREEETLQARFEAALADDRLSGPVRDAVLRAYDLVKPGHDAVRQAALAARGEA